MLLKKLSVSLITFTITLASFAVTVDAQQRRRQSRRVTNPVRRQSSVPRSSVITAPSSDAEIISTADELNQPDETQRGRSRSSRGTRATNNQPTAQQTIEKLTTEINTLRNELKSVRDDQRTLVDLERLGRAEQRAENYREQLRQIQEKEANAQARLEQIAIELNPQNIEIRASSVGTTRPELVRQQIQQAFENERTRLQNQLNTLITSRARLEQTIASTDAEVDRLRARVESSDAPPTTTTTTQTTDAANANQITNAPQPFAVAPLQTPPTINNQTTNSTTTPPDLFRN